MTTTTAVLLVIAIVVIAVIIVAAVLARRRSNAAAPTMGLPELGALAPTTEQPNPAPAPGQTTGHDQDKPDQDKPEVDHQQPRARRAAP